MNPQLNKKVKKYLDSYFRDTKANSPEHQEAVMLILKGALTDANFHSEAKQLGKYFPKASKKYIGTPMEGVIEDKGVDIAKMAKWDGHDIIDAIAFYLSMSIGGSFGNRLMSLKESIQLNEKNEPNNKELWSRAIAAAKAKYDVYPSAYANAFASNWYKEKGGTWKTKSESVTEELRPDEVEFIANKLGYSMPNHTSYDFDKGPDAKQVLTALKKYHKDFFRHSTNKQKQEIVKLVQKITTESVNESKEEVTPQQLSKIQSDIRKINSKIKVYISKHPITKGELSIELGAGHNDDSEIQKIYKVLKKHTGDWRTGTMFNESVNEADVKKKINRRGDVDGLLVKHNGKEYHIVYSGDFGISSTVMPYGIVMPDDDTVSFLSKDRNAKTIWKQLKPKVDKFLKSNESVNEAYIVTYTKKKGEKPASAAFQLRGSALSFEKDLKKDGYITMITQKKVKGIDESVSEAASRTAMEIGGLTGVNKDAIQKFVDDNKLDIEKLYQFVKKGKLADRMKLVSAIAGKPNNPVQKKMVKQFGEGIIKEAKVRLGKDSVNFKVMGDSKGLTLIAASGNDLDGLQDAIENDVDVKEELRKTLEKQLKVPVEVDRGYDGAGFRFNIDFYSLAKKVK